MRPLKLVIGVLLPTRDRHGVQYLQLNLQFFKEYVKTRGPQRDFVYLIYIFIDSRKA